MKSSYKILYLNHYAGSPQMGMEFRPYYLARSWVRSGHQVKMVAAAFSHLRLKNPTVSGLHSSEEIDGIEYHWLKTPSYRGNGPGRLVNIFVFLLNFLLFFPKWISFKPDVVIASSTYPLDVLPALVLGRLVGAKVVHEVHDLWPLTLISLHGMSETHPFIALLSWAEKFSYRHVDYVVSMLPGSDRYFLTKGMSPEKYHLVPNGFDSEGMPSGTGESFDGELRKMFSYPGYEDHFKVGYAGYFGEANALDDLLKVAQNLKDEKVLFILVGDGPLKQNLQAEATEKQLKILFLPKVEKKQIQPFLNSVDACYIGWKKSDLYKYGISPNKLLDYMASGKPVIHATSALVDLVQMAQCGVTTEAENLEGIQRAILQLMTLSMEERSQIGARGRRYLAAHLGFHQLADSFLKFITKE